MRSNVIYILFIALFICATVYSQSSDSTISVQLIESILPEPGIDFQEYNEIDELESLRNNPVNINNADLFTLVKVPGLDLNYANLIINFREKYGHLFSCYELYSIKELPGNIVKNILPFITTSDHINKDRIIALREPSLFKINFKTRSSYDFHDNIDSIYNKYAGSKLKMYNRLSLNYNSIDFGLLTEKDAGEKSYIDLLSSHLMIKNTRFFDIIMIGDYRFESGMGLILGTPSGFSKTIDPAYPVKKKLNIIEPNNNANETSYCRGIAFSGKYNSINISGFFSNRFIDASIDSNGQTINSLLTTGYHRSASELKTQNAVHEIKWGFRNEFNISPSLNASLLFCRCYFDKPFFNSIPFSIEGNKFNDLSFGYEFNTLSTIYLTGEFAYDFNSVASVNTLQLSITKDFLFFCSIRNYPRNFISISGHSLSEQIGKIQNEVGFYNGFKYETNYGLFNFYYDQFRFPFCGNRFPNSNSGEEFLIGYSNSFSNQLNVKFNYKYENKDYLLIDTLQKYIGQKLRNDFRFSVQWDLPGIFNVKTAVEYNSIRIKQNHSNEQGILLSNSVSTILCSLLNFALSVSFFKTNSYYSSVYEYEEFINGLITGRLLYGEGLKLNIFMKLQLFSNINMSAQYSETYKPKESLVNPLNSIITNNLVIQVEINL